MTLNSKLFLKFILLISVLVSLFVLSRSLDPARAATVGKSPAITASTTCPGLSCGLVGYWTFDGKDTSWTANTTADKSGNGNTGAMTNMSTSTSPAVGKIGQALKFDGVDDLVSTNSDSIGEGADTIVAWVLPKSFGEGSVGRIVDNGQASLRVNSTNSLFQFSSDGFVTTAASANSAVSLNKWHFVAVSRASNGTANIYVNGALSGTANQSSGTPAAGATNVMLGNVSAGSATFDGLIDDVRVYNRALSAGEIGQIYNQGVSKYATSPINTLKNGLVGHWTFDGPNLKNNVADSSGQGNNGFMSGFTSTSTAVVPGKVGQALNFDGVDDSISIGAPSSLNLSAAMTASAWIKTKAIDSGADIIVLNASGSNIRWSFEINRTAAKITWIHGGKSPYMSVTSNTSLKTNIWYHVAAVRTGSSGSWTITFYLNGVADGAPTGTDNPGTSQSVKIGNLSTGNLQFNGFLDDIRVYNRALSAREIGQIYNQGASKYAASPVNTLKTGLVGYWTFDGPKLKNNVTDSSGQGNNGYMSGFTSTSTAVTSGKLGQGLKFDGVNDYVKLGTSVNSYLSVSNNFTISAWFNTKKTCASSPYCTIVGSALGSTDRTYVQIWGNNICAVTYDGSFHGYCSSGSVLLNKWRHVVMTKNGSIVSGYLDGVSFNGTAGASTILTAGTAIGADQIVTSLFNGSIDDVRIYSRALSATEVKQLYNLGR